MIIDKVIKVKIAKYNIEHYSKFFDINLRDIIEIDVEKYLQKSSNIKINVQCDLCNIQRYIKYQAYTKNINSCERHPIYTCDRCSHLKIKEFNKEKYGVEYYSQTIEYTEKFKSTMLDRYGVEYALQSRELRDRVNKTNLEKFGYMNPFMDKKKIRNDFLLKHGVDHPSKVESIYNKIKESNLKTTGYESPLSSPIIREQVRLSNIESRGVDHHMKDDNYRSFIITRDRDYISYVSNSISLFNCENGHEFEISTDLYHNRMRSNISLCTICYPISDQKSIKEKELFKFIQNNYSGDIISGYRDGLEIDIYLPELKIGFEFNGLYWHSDEYKDKSYHINKTNSFKDKGIRIIHIWEDDFDFRISIVKSQILNLLGISKSKVYGRKCEVRLIKDSKEFLDNNHIQGSDKSIIKLGLYYDDSLLSIMTFDKFEGRKKMEENSYNLSRFCNKINYNVIGGASKLLSYFIKQYDPIRIVSYADKDWSIGQLYHTLGFSNISESKPDYKYILDGRRVHKSRYRKSRTNISESNLNLVKIWDCGKIKFEYKKTH